MTAIKRRFQLFMLTLLLCTVLCECKKTQDAFKKKQHSTAKTTGSYRSGSYKSSSPQKRSTRFNFYRSPTPKRTAPLYSAFDPTAAATASLLPAAAASFYMLPQPMFPLGNWNLNSAPLALPRKSNYQSTSPMRLVITNREASRRSDNHLDDSSFISSINTNIADILPRGLILDLGALNQNTNKGFYMNTNIENQLFDVLNTKDFSRSDIAVMSFKPSLSGGERFGGIQNINVNDLYDVLANQYELTLV